MQSLAVLIATLAGIASSQTPQDTQTLISFPGVKWIENNDPIMGGQSHGNWSVVGSYGLFQGTVKNVSFLHAPGFCRAITISPFFKDASQYIAGGLVLTVRTTTPDYKGFKLSLGSLGTPKHHSGHEIEGSYKAKFTVPASKNGEWQSIFLKFDEFSYDWSDYTGDCATKDPDGYQHQCCTKETPSVCPTAKPLRGINSFNVWAEGAEGDFHIELKEIAATMHAVLV